MDTLCKVMNSDIGESLKGIMKYVIPNIKHNVRYEGKDVLKEMLVDYGRTNRDYKIKLDYNKYKPDDPYSGSLMIGTEYFSYFRHEIPTVVWEWVVDYYFMLSRFGIDERLPLGFKIIATNFIEVSGYEENYKASESLTRLVRRCIDVANNSKVEEDCCTANSNE